MKKSHKFIAVTILLLLILVNVFLYISNTNRWCNSNQGLVLKKVDNNICWERVLKQDFESWETSNSYCQNLSYDERDWVLPSKKDFEKLLNFLKKEEVSENFGSYLNEKEGFIFFKNSGYWSNVDDEDRIAIINMKEGLITQHYTESIYNLHVATLCVSYK